MFPDESAPSAPPAVDPGEVDEGFQDEDDGRTHGWIEAVRDPGNAAFALSRTLERPAVVRSERCGRVALIPFYRLAQKCDIRGDGS